LTAEWFELHDHADFETFAFSLSPAPAEGDAEDPMRTRLQKAFDHFLDVAALSDLDIARQARALGLDVAVDLCGFTGQHRMGVFAARAAPLQLSYIGYLGTSGASYMDYLVADEVLVPAQEAAHYSEKILYLPCYQVNDRQRPQVTEAITAAALGPRSAHGLPDPGFVFCCFNNHYKINPEVFDDWMAILQAVPHSVLWLLGEHPNSERQLRHEAEQRGVAGERLVFAPRTDRALYLARYTLADLFLDTRPYNAGTTASDALWAGLPVLTCPGRSFSSRMAASLLTGLHSPELIANDRQDYVDKAIQWGRLGTQTLKDTLRQRRLQAPLFDTPQFARHWEAALKKLVTNKPLTPP
jgi:predicted O-linked N-acetylglucosamine transferase (SPINDLY family)